MSEESLQRVTEVGEYPAKCFFGVPYEKPRRLHRRFVLRLAVNGVIRLLDIDGNTRLWDGFIFGRFDDAPAITLRDIKHGFWNADTLLILAKDHAPEPAHLLDFVAPIYDSGELDDLWELAVGWCPAELEWVPAERTALMLGASEKHKLLRVWWD
jgi:hypothetical protein